MKIASRFQTRPDGAGTLNMTLDGTQIQARLGDSVAAAILAHTGDPLRITGKGVPRGAFCMMGTCFECLVEIDGRANIQACMTPVQDGMEIRTQDGLRTIGASVND